MPGRMLFDVGANYLNKFGDFTVALYGAFAYASFVPGLLAVRRLRPTWRPVPTSPRGSSGCSVLSSASPASPSVARSATTTTASVRTTSPASTTTPASTPRASCTRPARGRCRSCGPASTTPTATARQRRRRSRRAPTSRRSPRCGRRAGRQQHLLQRQSGDRSARSVRSTVNKWEIGANYALGPGVKMTGGAMMYNVGGPTNAVSGNSWAFLLGMDLRF